MYSSRSTRPMTPSECVRGRSATPWSREEKVLYNLLFVVWPQVSTCGKKEPVSHTLYSEACATGRKSSYTVVPHGDLKTLSPLLTISTRRLRSRNTL